MIELVALPGSRTGVRADGQVVWLAPSTAADAIPATAKALEVVELYERQIVESFDITEASKVEALRK